jgi:cytochrome c nitrite reductase small subunit
VTRWHLSWRVAGPVALAICVLTGVMLGTGAYTFWYAQGASYFSNDPNNCANCHVMREHLDSWQKASHHAWATCNDCHLPKGALAKWIAKADNGFWHSKGFTLQDFHEPIRIKPRNSRILQENCISCHYGLVADLLEHGSLGDDTNSCVRCHAEVGHGPPR